MFWKANKWGLAALAVGLAIVAALYFHFKPQDEEVAERVLSTGVCGVLFLVALASYLTARK